METITLEFKNKNQLNNPYKIHLKTIKQSLVIALVHGTKEQIRTYRLELMELISLIEHAEFCYAHPILSQKSKQEAEMEYDRRDPNNKPWTFIDGKKVFTTPANRRPTDLLY